MATTARVATPPASLTQAAADPWTIGRMLDWMRKDFAGRGIGSPRLDAELLLATALGLERVQLYVRYDQPLVPAELSAIRALVERRRKMEPVAYLTGSREFLGRRFAVTRDVLIPRPETEHVVERALAMLPSFRADETVHVLDVGTGSGILAVSLALARPDVRVDAVDLSPAALSVARANAERHGVTAHVTFHEGSVYGPVADRRFHAIVSNPPYLRSEEIPGLMPDVRLWEPHLALDGGGDGLRVLEPLVIGAREHLHPGGAIVIELSHDQKDAALALAARAGLEGARVDPDLAGIPRVFSARAR